MIASPKIRLAIAGPQKSGDSGAFQLDLDLLVAAEDIAVLPADIAAGTFVGAKANGRADGAMLALVDLYGRPDPPTRVRGPAEANLHGAEQSGVEQHLSALGEELGRHQVTRPPRQAADRELGIDVAGTFDAGHAEASQRPRQNRQGEVHDGAVVIDHRAARLQPGEGEALLPDPAQECCLGIQNGLRDRRIARCEAERGRVRPFRRLAACLRRRRRNVDDHALQAIDRAGINGEDDPDRQRIPIDLGRDLGAIVALGAQHADEVGLIVLGAPAQSDPAVGRTVEQASTVGDLLQQQEEFRILDTLERHLVAQLRRWLRCRLGRCGLLRLRAKTQQRAQDSQHAPGRAQLIASVCRPGVSAPTPRRSGR